ncbi:MAG: helix-turn-helix domain-containing protein [Oscillospiraceae bacterium]
MKENRETISSIIGERIRIFRTEQKLSQEELAFLSEIHPAYIGKVERGEKCPTIETLYKIANGLKIPLHKLLNIESGTEIKETDAYYRIKNALDGLNPEQMLRVVEIVERITELMDISDS